MHGECFREVGSRKMPLLCNAQLCPCWQSWASSNRQFPCLCCLESHTPLFTAGSRREDEAMPVLSLSLLSTLSRLCSFQPPSWLPVGDTTAPSREKKIVLPFAHQVLSVVPLLCPAQRGVVAQTTARKRNTRVFQHLSLPTKKQGNSSFHRRNARV